MMGRRSREVAIPESSPLSHPSFSPFEARRGGEGEEGARVLTLTQGRQARGPADASRLSSSCSLSTLSSPPLDSRQQRSSSSSSSTSGCSRSERCGGDEEVVGHGFPIQLLNMSDLQLASHQAWRTPGSKQPQFLPTCLH